MSAIRLRLYDNSWYRPGRSVAWRAAWMLAGLPLLRCTLLPFSTLRVWLLRAFGAHIGARVVIRSGVNVKYPWHLRIGNDCWIGEQVWIDNLTTVVISNDVCISQGAYLCTGNHDWSDACFGLRIAPLHLAEGSWAAAHCILLPGTVLHTGAVVSAGSVASGEVPPFTIVSGNPAVAARRRVMRGNTQPELNVREVVAV